MKYICDTCKKEFSGWRNPKYKHKFCCIECHNKFVIGNKIEILDDYAVMYIKSKNQILQVLIDKEDVDKVKRYTWHASYQKDIANYYIETNKKISGGKFMLFLHRYLMDAKDSLTIDHINHNTLDNRKLNLRVCSQKENNLNQAELRRNNKTGYRNISWQKSCEKYIVTLMIDGKNKTIGRTSSLDDAVKMRDKAKRQYGVKSVYNFKRLSNKCK